MLYPPIDPNERFRERRRSARRRKRLQRGILIGALLVAVALLGLGAQFVGRGADDASPTAATAAVVTNGPRPLPVEIRGVHVTMALASLPGKLEEYVDLEREGLTAIELDVKDENGEVGFTVGAPRLAKAIGATRNFYKAGAAARLVHDRGLYLIGRIVVFEDPVLAHARPELAVRRSDGSVWEDSAGLGWANPYDRRVWDYNVDVAEAAARGGFDEIMFDYVRFPSDGDVDSAVYSHRAGLRMNDVAPAFLRYAARRLEPQGVRVSAAVFGLSAMRDMGVGQIPRRMAPYLHALYAMTYPSLFGAGELGLADPSAAPGATVARALKRFQRALRGRDVLLLPWVQDFSFTTPYGKDEVRAQIYSARVAGSKGYLLWNASGVYTEGTLTPPS
ncbi:MAG: putative glycoside hydrolase [Gaiellaceae bacterium]